MEYQVGDKVRIKSIDWYNENKDEHGYINCGSRAFFTKMSDWCGEILTIRQVVEEFEYYCVSECIFSWTDEMIEGLVEEDCPQDFIEKYCKSCGTQRCDRTKEYLDGCPYYNEYMCEKQNNDMKKEMSLDKAGQITDFEYEGLAYTLPDGYQFVDDNGNVINTTKIVLEKKKKEYPKTYEQCCKIMGVEVADLLIWDNMLDPPETIYYNNLERLLHSFRKLIICRDAYWKIAGEEMGLDCPWEPDWEDDTTKYTLVCINNGIEKDWELHINHILAFPTAEMRDAFYENFKEEIEICKELL